MTDHRTVQVRREIVNKLWSWDVPCEEILKIVKEKLPEEKKTTMNCIYQDIEYLKEVGKEYIERKFIPEFGQMFMKAVTNIEQSRREARSLFNEGITKTKTIKLANGSEQTEEIHESKNLTALRLAVECDIVLINLADTAPVLQQAMRLKETVDLLKREQIRDASAQ